MIKKNIIRQANIDKVTSALFKHEKMFASEIVETTKISMVTVNSLLKELVDKELLFENPNVQRDIGRPAAQYDFNYDYAHSLLLTFREVDHKLLVDTNVIDLKGKSLLHETEAFSDISPANFQLLVAAKIKGKEKVQSIAVLLPGKISDGVVTSSWFGLMDGWNLKELLGEITDIDCYFQNDAHALTVGYCIVNQIPLTETIVGIYYPQDTMPGATILANSQLLEGHDSLAGEVKFLPNFLDEGSPKNLTEYCHNLNNLIATYNAIIAPDRFVLSIDSKIRPQVIKEIASNNYLPQQLNAPIIHYTDNIEQCIIFGLHWLIYKDSPFELAIY